ncbi:MAG: tandem-95 repeat protein [Caldilineaceae bacterium]|nr:tandem-95 repeat protein [Caldilineaceae bacterium]
MNAMKKYLSGFLLIVLVGAGVGMMTGWERTPIAPVMPGKAKLAQASMAQAAHAARAADAPFQIDMTLQGVVDLTWGAQGVFTDTWTADELNTLNDETAMDITFLVQQGAGNAVTSYVELENSLVFTTEHVISTTVPSDATTANPDIVSKAVGPQSSGNIGGNQLNLISERIAYTTEAGQTVQRQFRLTASPNQDATLFTGEYRETVWGLTHAPLTVGGVFQLRKLQSTSANANRAPVANPQTVATAANTAKTITLTGSDANSDALTYAIVTAPTRGALSGTPPNITYTPRAGFTGSDSFTFRVNDGQVDSDAAAVKITVEGQGSGNRAPQATNDTATTSAGQAVTISVLANDSDPDGDALTVTILQQPQHGNAVLNGATIVYTPDSGYVGADSFTYTVTDSKGATANATVTITVQPGSGNRAPQAANDTATTSAGQAVTINVLANDSDPDGDALTVTILQQPQHGSAVVNGVAIVYTPESGYQGADTFTYAVTDGQGATASATVTITVQQTADGPAIYLPLIHNQ